MIKGWLIVSSVLCLIAASTPWAEAGDYYAYRDASGRLVLTNSPPPPGGKTIVKESLADVSQQEVAEAKAREEAAARENRITSLERTVDELEYRLRNQPTVAETVPPAYSDNGVFVGVSNGFIWPSHRPPRPHPQPNVRPSAPPSSLPGGIIPPGSLPGGKMG